MKEKENRLKEVKKNLAEKDRERNSLSSLPRSTFPTQAVKLGELPSATEEEISLENIFPLNSSTGTRTATLELLKTLFFDELIGTIQVFTSLTIPENYLPCDGGSHKIADYPKLAAKLDGRFNIEGEDPEKFRVPDLNGRFIRGAGTDNPFGVPQEDTLQHFTAAFGNAVFSDGMNDSRFWGAFSGSSPGTKYTRHNNTNDSDVWHLFVNGSVLFDTAKVARTSEETRPKNLPLLFAIRAK